MFPPDCELVARSLWDYLDRTLDDPRTAAIDAHLVECGHCRAHAEFERNLLVQIRALRRRHNDLRGLRTRVLQAIRRAGGTEG